LSYIKRLLGFYSVSILLFGLLAVGGKLKAAGIGVPVTVADTANKNLPLPLRRAMAFRMANQNDSAIAILNRLKASLDNATSSVSPTLTTEDAKLFLAKVNLELAYCSNAQQLQAAAMDVQLTSPGPGINSSANDIGLVFEGDQALVYFSSDRAKSGFPLTYTGSKTFAGFGSVHLMDGSLAGKSFITVGISIDGQQLYLMADNAKGEPELYVSKLVNGKWGSAVKLSERINEGLVKAAVSVSADGQYLYFSSKRAGGFGGADLYRSRLLPNGEWAVPLNLGSGVNSSFDEISPVLHPDGTTLFFSTNAPNSMGGFDIFFSVRESDTAKWMEPMNLGYPVNSGSDELFYWPTADNKSGYFASNRAGGLGGFDTYQNLFPEQKESNLTVYSGSVQKSDGTVLKSVEITVTDTKTGDLIGTYLPNGITGNYLIILTPGGHYTMTFHAEGFSIESRKLDVPLDSGYSVLNNTIELKAVVAVEKR